MAITMTVLERFKTEISKDYFSDDVYSLYLGENNLDPSATYNKATMQRNLLLTLLDIYQVLSNDIDLYRRTDTEFATTSDAFANLRQRIDDVQRRINAIQDPTNMNSVVSYLFYG
jgi:signal transduction protein with GAF and PtsI domain